MRNRIERLRIWLLAGAGLLVLVLVVFVGSARYLSHRFIAHLPAKLGLNIKSEMNGFTYSHSTLGGTMYTIHAAKEVEYDNGKIGLHDVTIVLYGRKQGLPDRIYGNEFEYDQGAQVIRAVGLVHIDLQTGEGQTKNGSGKAAPPDNGEQTGSREVVDPKTLHATTTGLVYLEKLGVAATGEEVQFQLGGLTGRAKGADYNTDSGLLTLHADVHVDGDVGGKTVALTAANAMLDQRNHRSVMTQAKYASGGDTAEAKQATLHTRPDSSLSEIEGQGDVTLGRDGATLVGERGDLVLDEQSRAHSAVLTGDVVYVANQPRRQARSQSDALRVLFDEKGQPVHAAFAGSVHMAERSRTPGSDGDSGSRKDSGKESWSVRELHAENVDAALVSVAAGKTQLRDVDAKGRVQLTLVKDGRTELSGDEVKAHLIAGQGGGNALHVDSAQARGHTLLRQIRLDGVEQTSAGDTLEATFRAEAPGKAASGPGIAKGGEKADMPSDLVSAFQQGHVVMTRKTSLASGQQAEEHAAGQRAVYDGDTNRTMLRGDVQLDDGESELWADQVALDQKTGDARAEGAVKVSYAQANAASRPQSAGSGSSAQKSGEQPREPAHVIAERAELDHAAGITTFYGSPARLWQGGSKVEAPVLELMKKESRLIARGETRSPGAGQTEGAMPVHTTLVSARGDKPSSGTVAAKATPPGLREGKRSGGSRTPSVVRIDSRQMNYSDLLHQAEFTGGVHAESSEGTLKAGQATVYLHRTVSATGAEAAAKGAGQASAQALGGGSAPDLSSGIDRVIAERNVEIEQPGRRGTGSRVVYTASDQTFILTGDASTPPKVTDAVHGTTTGAVLRFQSGDDSVAVYGAAPAEAEAPSARARTDTRMKR